MTKKTKAAAIPPETKTLIASITEGVASDAYGPPKTKRAKKVAETEAPADEAPIQPCAKCDQPTAPDALIQVWNASDDRVWVCPDCRASAFDPNGDPLPPARTEDLHGLARRLGVDAVAEAIGTTPRRLIDLRRPGGTRITGDDLFRLMNAFPTFSADLTVQRLGADRETKGIAAVHAPKPSSFKPKAALIVDWVEILTATPRDLREPKGGKGGRELRFKATPETRDQVVDALAAAGVKAGKPYQKSAHAWTVPVYGAQIDALTAAGFAI